MNSLLSSAVTGASCGGESAPGEPADPDPLSVAGSMTGSAASVGAGHGEGVGVADVQIVDATGRLGVAEVAWLQGRAREALRYLGVGGQVQVRILDEARMDEAHRRYSGVEGTTDVLTFDLREHGPDGKGAGPLDTDMLVCLDEAERQGCAHGHEARRELLLYIVHGVLHCLGHDDRDPASSARMHQREDEILTAIGVGPTFGAPPTDPARRAGSPGDPGTAGVRERTG
jgi:probable rRNA maturation factor